MLRFHAVYWPAMLLASGQPLPTVIFVHDYLTADGRKISKSARGRGACSEPAALAAEYGADAVRWWLLREVPRVGDADFTIERLIARADDELANGLGNLVNRVVAMIHRYRDGRIPAPAPVPPGGEDLDAAIRLAGDRVGTALAGFDFRQATAAVWAIADEANRFINRARPWDLAKADPGGRSMPCCTCSRGPARRPAGSWRRSCPTPRRGSPGSARPATGGSRRRLRCSGG